MFYLTIIWNVNSIYYIFATDKESRQRERNRSLLLFSKPIDIGTMNPDNTVQQLIESYIAFLLKEDEDTFLVNVKVILGNNIRVFLDADNGITIEKCTRLNRALYKQIEENNLFPGGDFSLEVSSPGVAEPLKLQRQYKKNVGRLVEVTMNDDVKKTGKLIGVSDDEITIEEKESKSKKVIIKINNILFNQIKHVKVLVTF